MKILGIDPGSRVTGYGCVRCVGNQLLHVGDGVFRLGIAEKSERAPLELRLRELYEDLNRVIRELAPDVLVVERVFFAKNAVSSLKLGQVRGVVLLCGAIHSLKVVEYSPSEVKASVAGHGQADKAQVARAVQLLVGKRAFATHDASDALALAACHGLRMLTDRRMASGAATVSAALGGKKRSSRSMNLAESLGIKANGARRKARLGEL